VVDIDITKFFDHVSHDIPMVRIGKVIRDKRVLGPIGKYLRRGAMVEGVVVTSEEGTPQGGPLSPDPGAKNCGLSYPGSVAPFVCAHGQS
jgi:retron-type reverse transcriptase